MKKTEKMTKTKEPAPERRTPGGLILKNRRGQIRPVLILIISIAIYVACVPLVEWLYWTGFNALIRLWGITESNMARAPWLIRQFMRFSGVILTVVQSLILIFLSGLPVLKRLSGVGEAPLHKYAAKSWLRGAAWGAGSLLALWALLLLGDNMRLGHSLLKPSWSADIPALALTSLFFAAGGLAWGIGFSFEAFRHKMPLSFAVLLGSALLVPILLNSTKIDAVLLVNLLLCGALLCLSAEKEGDWSWAFGFLAALWLMERAVLGFPGYSAALYETYPVNGYWLNGGESGLWHGIGLSAVMLFHIARLTLFDRKKSFS